MSGKQVIQLRTGTKGLTYSGKTKEYKETRTIDDKRKRYPNDNEYKQQKEKKMNLSKLTKDELLKMVQASQAQQQAGLMVKRNSSGGVYIRSDKFVEWSDKKQKSYTAGINLPANTAKQLFNDPAMIEMIRDAVNTME